MHERESIKFTIQRNVYGYLGILLAVRERLEEECLAEMRRQCSSSQTVASGTSVFLLTCLLVRITVFFVLWGFFSILVLD